MQTDTPENSRSLSIKGKGMARNQKVEIKELPMNKIKLGRNSRLSVSEEDLSGLMQSINSTGLLEPIGVVLSKDEKSYEVAYGNRRFMAFSKLGLHSIPCVIHQRYKDSDVDVKNLAENVQRRNISLAEVGRYAKILEGENLNRKELAIRLGVTNSYLESCLQAYNDVPANYREDIEPSVHGKKRSPGKLSMTAVRGIINSKKAHGLKKIEVAKLFEAAKNDERFTPENISKYVAAIKRGASDPIGSVRPIKTVTFRLMINESEYDSLCNKYVLNGPFNSFTALVKSVLRGQKQVSINFLE